MVLVDADPLIPTARILKLLDEHGPTTAMLVLSGVQWLTGQLLDIPTITKHAHSKGVIVCWDLAHAVGNVELKLHEWDVDLAVWVTYKYMNCGPGNVGGSFVHERLGEVDESKGHAGYRQRLAGWWGSKPVERFKMENDFKPSAGAAGFQVSNVSVMDLTAVLGSLDVFEKAGGMGPIREKSLKMTAYLEHLLQPLQAGSPPPFVFITSQNPSERGAQLTLKLRMDLVDTVMQAMDEAKIVLDVRKVDGITRVTPSPLYNTFAQIHYFVDVLGKAFAN